MIYTNGLRNVVLAALIFTAHQVVRGEDLRTILRNGDHKALEAALKGGADVNARDQAGNTPLMHAAVYSSPGAMRSLIERGAEVNAANSGGATALMRAAFDYEKVRLLVEKGADVNARSRLGNTPLMIAARNAQSRKTVELLLSRGADAKATNQFGATALMAAAAGGDEGSVRLLLKAGADVNAQPAANDMGFILGGGRSALMWAAFRGDVAICKLLLDAGADVNAAGGLGTALSQAAWADRTATARLLIARGADVNKVGPVDGYAPLHWAASSEEPGGAMVKLLLDNKANPNVAGGESIDAFAGTAQTPLMLAAQRGETTALATLRSRGATNGTLARTAGRFAAPEKNVQIVQAKLGSRQLPEWIDTATLRAAIEEAVQPLQETAVFSKKSFVAHSSKQNCTSCHQQYLPMAAVGYAVKQGATVDAEAREKLIEIVKGGELPDIEADWQPIFHPDAVYTKGYELFALAGEGLPAVGPADAWVHHLASIQGEDGQWYNNLPRPPIQTGDIGATALGIHALQRYPFPNRKGEFEMQVGRARAWLWKAKASNNEGRIFQILGLAWAGEPQRKLQSLAKGLVAQQNADGGWSQLPTLASDAYATGQAIYALRVGAGLPSTDPAINKGLRFLLRTQLPDGTWHVKRRAFPFQPTMKSGFPHGKDAWISAAGSSWAVMALSLPYGAPEVAAK